MEHQQPHPDAITSRLLVLNIAIAAMAAASPNRPTILAYFDKLSEQLIADLLANPASDKTIALARSQIQDLRKILLTDTTQ